MFLSLGLSDTHSWLDCGYGLLGGRPQRWSSLLTHPIRGPGINMMRQWWQPWTPDWSGVFQVSLLSSYSSSVYTLPFGSKSSSKVIKQSPYSEGCGRDEGVNSTFQKGKHLHELFGIPLYVQLVYSFHSFIHLLIYISTDSWEFILHFGL